MKTKTKMKKILNKILIIMSLIGPIWKREINGGLQVPKERTCWRHVRL